MTAADLFTVAPELLLLLGACVVLIAGVGAGRSMVAPIALVAVLAALGLTLTLHGREGATAIPGLWITSITFYARTLTLIFGAVVILVNWFQAESAERGEFMAMILLSLLGVLLTASANDLVVLFFAIELVSVPTYVLIALSRSDVRASESAVKYFFLGALAAAVLAYGFAFLYGAFGTTTLFSHAGGAWASTWTVGGALPTLAVIGLLFVFGGLAFKIAAVPFHVYAPDVYEGASSSVTGLLGFVPKFAGFIALIKVLAALNWLLPESLNWVLWLMAACSMTFGNVLALLQQNVKRMLAYSSIAHTGYMLIAVVVGPVAGSGPMKDGVAALLFYIAIYGLMNLGVFAVLTAFRSGERAMETLEDVSGLAKRAPLAALALAVCVFSLMGFPPTAGFLGKLYVFSAAFSVDASRAFHGPIIALAIIGVINSAIAAAYYLRIVAAAYVREDVDVATSRGGFPVRAALALCALPMLAFFVLPGHLAAQAKRATVTLHESISTHTMQRAGAEPLTGPSRTANAAVDRP